MKIYQVLIQIEKYDETSGHHLKLDQPFEAGKFSTEIVARRFVEDELITVRPLNTKLHWACQHALDSLMKSLSEKDHQGDPPVITIESD